MLTIVSRSNGPAFRRRLGFAMAGFAVLLSGCTSLSDLTSDPSVAPSDRPIIADNVRSGRLARIGAAQHPRILEMYGGEYSDPKLERMVAGIVGQLVTVSDNPSQVYQITILNSPVINAFALPGGYLYVSRGLLALASDSAELAAVIAHEMGHVTANHGILRQKKEAEAELASRAVGVLSDKDAGRRALVREKVELAQFSRNQELEADAIGIAAIGEAGIDPYAAADFQKSMAEYNAYRSASGSNDEGLDFLSTHPSTPQRVTLAVGHASKFGPRGSVERGRASYQAGIDGMLYGDSPEEGYVRGQRYSHANLGITFAFPDGFEVENRTDAVQATRPSDGAAVRFDGIEVPAGQPLTTYLASGWVEGLDLASVQPVTANGLEGASGRAQVGRWDFEITLLRANGSVYRILTAVPAGSSDLLPIAQGVRGSFRLLSADEKANLKPLRIRIVKAGPSDSVARLAARMAEVPQPERLFRILNGLSPSDGLQAGQSYKIVTP